MCKLSFAFALFLKVLKSKSWESISKSSDKERKGDKKSALIFERLCFIFWNFFHRAVASPVSNVGDWISWTFQNQWLNVADGAVEQTIPDRVSAVLLFHKCLPLLCLGLYTVPTLSVNNDPAIAAHICYISLLRCNY